jgi:transposase
MKKSIYTTNYIGIDVSKLMIDVTVLNSKAIQQYQQFENNLQGYRKFLRWSKLEVQCDFENSLICMEHTGLYTRQLLLFLLQHHARVWMESALQIKRSMGMARGKNDKIDSYRIARYAMTNQDQAICVTLASATLQKLKDLISNRERLVKSFQSIKIAMQELSRIDKSSGKELEKINLPALKGLIKSKVAVEKRMMTLIQEDAELNKLYDLVTSVKCVGSVLATELLVYTHGFNRMQNSRQLACYCGIAPFEHSSGTSVRGRTGTSNFANMNLKSTLHMAAISATRYVPEIKTYYERKVAEGKHKMCVINAIRNKLIQRIIAVVNRGTPYVENYSKNNLELA